jgi:hypothetical protein
MARKKAHGEKNGYSFNKSAVVSYPKYSRKNNKHTNLTKYLE